MAFDPKVYLQGFITDYIEPEIGKAETRLTHHIQNQENDELTIEQLQARKEAIQEWIDEH